MYIHSNGRYVASARYSGEVGDEKEGRKEKETKGETDFFVYSLVYS